MANGWQEVPLKEIAKPVIRSVPVETGTSYRTIGVKWWGMGAYERVTIDGSRTAAKTLSIVREDDLIINKIWVRHGSVAIATKDVDGCAGSGEFPTFELDLNRIDPRWIHWQTKMTTFWEKCDSLSRGTSGKNRIKPELFLTVKIPLPPILEQRRIVARIEALAERVAAVQSLRREVSEEAEAIWHSSLNKVFQFQKQSTLLTLEEVCTDIIDNLHTTPKYNGNEFPCIRSQDVGWGTVNFSTALRVSSDEFTQRNVRGEPQVNDIVFVREGDVGRCAIVVGGQRFCLGQRVMMLRPNQQFVLPKFLLYQLMSPPVLRRQLLEGMTGTTSKHLNIGKFRKVKFVVFPLAEQGRMVTYLEKLKAQMYALQSAQTETERELAALMPSVLDRAFKGEL